MQESRLAKVLDFIVDSLFDFATIAVAAYLVIRHQVQPFTAADIAELASGILAVLGLIAVSGIWDRNRRMRRIETLSRETNELVLREISGKGLASDFLLTDTALTEEFFASANKIILTGITLQNRTRQFTHVLEQRLRAGASIQLVLLEPSDSNLQQMVARGWGQATPEYYRRIINTTVDRLESIGRKQQNRGQIEIGYLPFYPAMAFEMVNPDQPHGTCWVTILPHKSTRASPTFRLKASEDPHWYEFFREQFVLLWSSCRVEKLPKQISQPDTKDRAADLREAMYGSTHLPIGGGPSRIFHAQCPYVVPVCFKNPKRSEYTYIVVGTRVEDATADDEKARIVTEPGLAKHKISSVTVMRGRWYQLTSERPLKSIRFGGGPRIEDFVTVEAQIHPVRAWNKHTPVTVPSDRSRAYGLAITEQKGPSTWFVSIDDERFTFNKNLGCHFVEFVLPEGQQHDVAFGYEEGPWGIACAFFAF